MRALLLLVVAAPAFAQPTPVDTITKVEATYAGAKQVTASIAQTVVNATFGNTQTSQATLAFERPMKIEAANVNKKGNADKTFLFDAQDFYLVDHQNKRVTKQAASANSLPGALAFLTGTKGTTAKQFTIAAPTDPSHLVPGSIVVELTPRQPSAAYKTIELVVDPTAFTVTKSIVYAPDGGSTTYAFSAVDLKAKLPAAKFVFNPKSYPPGWTLP